MSVVVTGLGALCALGESAGALWAAIERGASGISPIRRFDVTPFDVHLGAMVRLGDDSECEAERLLAYGRAAAEEALQQAGVADRGRVALLVGTCNGLLGNEIHHASADLAEALKIGGPSLTFSTACASSAHAIGFAAALLRQGPVDYVLAGGIDTLCLDVFAGFHSLGLLSKTPCAPFSTQMGTTLGEGAAFLLLETEQSAGRRGADPLAKLMGCGLSADAFHDTKPDPSGTGMARALAAALKDADLLPEDVDYLNAHGTATAANDAAEWRAIQRVFGDAANSLPVSSSKSFLGHAQGAAGALEAVVTLMAMARDVVPPTTNFTQPRPNSPVDPVASAVPRPQVVRHAVCANAAFGGANTALVFGRMNGRLHPKTHERPDRRPRPIGLASTGTVRDGNDVSRYVPRAELRGTDSSARLLAGAVAAALTAANIRLRSAACEGIGLFAAQARVSPESVEAFDESIRERGRTHLSAPAFTRMVVNYATGVCCRLFGLKGPTATMATESGGGIAALILAADHLAWHEDADYLLAAAVDEPASGDDSPATASALLLNATGNKAPVRLAGWALAAGCDSAVEHALKMAGLTDAARRTGTGPIGELDAVTAAMNALSNGEPGPILIVGRGAAVILEAGNSYAS